MAKLEMPVIESLYAYGKAFYEKKISLEDATEKVLKKYPDGISKTSAEFYIALYSDYLSGRGSTWNQNSSLVMYYVEHIADECGEEEVRNAYSAAMKIAEVKKKQRLIKELKEFWDSYSSDEPPAIPDLYEADFENWLRKDSGKQYLDNTIRRYIRAMKKVEEWFGVTLDEPLLNIGGIQEYDLIVARLKALPDFDTINQNHGHGDLSAAVGLYRKFLLSIESGESDDSDDEDPVTMSTRDALNSINAYISACGFQYPAGLIENFYLSLKSKPFVILAGTSGTGKTRLVKLFAEAIGADYYLVPVRPDWSDGSDLFGHHDLNGQFVRGPVCDAFDAAIKNPRRPVLLCLDEMNLARVEYYLSDFLSVIESRELQDGRVCTDPIAQYASGIPDNLYIVGTVNMDETTFPFSKKVLDRANTIEFNYVNLIPNYDAGTDVVPLSVQNSFLRSEYLVLARDCAAESEYVNEVCQELQLINEILLRANAHVGYRVRDEIVFYILNNHMADGLLEDQTALDNEIMQKILPRIQGSSAAVRDMLCDLFKECASDPSQKTGDSDSERMDKVLHDEELPCKYRKSAEKIEMMVRRFEEDGFTSYWL